jgi:hypothetical protein
VGRWAGSVKSGPGPAVFTRTRRERKSPGLRVGAADRVAGRPGEAGRLEIKRGGGLAEVIQSPRLVAKPLRLPLLLSRAGI